MTKGRLEAFSDGIIAIIITITILLIDLPQGNEWPDLLAIMPLVICYLISFILVGTHWVNHHHLLRTMYVQMLSVHQSVADGYHFRLL